MARVKTLNYSAALVCAVLAIASLSAAAGDKKDKPALTGVWMQIGGEVKIQFADKDVMKIYPHGENEIIIVVCSYTLGKDALVKAKITELQGEGKEKAKEILPVGLEFSFQWQAKDAKATLDDLKGEKVEVLKSHLEGKYDQKK